MVAQSTTTSKAVTVHIRTELYDRLVALAHATGASLSGYVGRILAESIKPKPKEEKAEDKIASPSTHPLHEMAEFNQLLAVMEQVDKGLAPQNLSPSTCVALYEVFRAGRHGCALYLNSQVTNKS